MNVPEYLFVYGDLRTNEGHPLHNYLRGLSDYLGIATVGAIRVDVDGRAGVLPSAHPEDKVSGELYRIHDGAGDGLFGVLDRYEGCGEDEAEPGEFFRHRLQATLRDDALSVDAWVYLYRG
jgi:gamma-glutamylcyclotransferase (GGCT)/AIG2-like uncharacterized protein YtfP